MAKTRKIFLVVAGGNHDTDRHYQRTIEKKLEMSELKAFLNAKENEILEKNYYGGPFAVWGAVPGESNTRNWTSMEPGDYTLITRKGKVIFAAEIALKTHHAKLAEYLWKKDTDGKTWEYVYFMVNTESVEVPLSALNPLLGYSEGYFPRGFMAIEQGKVDNLLGKYGDVLSVLKQLELGKELEKVDERKKTEEISEVVDEKVERAPTEHDEMQWRLIRLGRKAHVDVWVPRNDQGKSYNGEVFRPQVLAEFQSTLDVPKYVENVDVVWKYGHSIKSAFEIEHSTSVYSGILRLSDLRALTPYSIYPLFIVASRERKNKVFSELKRPTFDNPYLKLKEAIRYFSYDKIRELDEKYKDLDANLGTKFLLQESEVVV